MLENKALPIAALLLLAAGAPSAALAQPQPSTTAVDDVARTVEAIARIQAAFGPSYSPDGRSLAYISNASGRPQVWVTRLDATGEPVQLTVLPDPAPAGLSGRRAGDWLAYAVAPGGGLNIQIYVMRARRQRGAAAHRGRPRQQLAVRLDRRRPRLLHRHQPSTTRPASTPSCSIPPPARRSRVADGRAQQHRRRQRATAASRSSTG